MPARKEDAHRALELLEDYYAKLPVSRPQEQQLKQALEQVIKIFKSSLFQALLDIHEFYEVTLMNDSKSVQQKTTEAQRMSSKFQQHAPFPPLRTDSPAAAGAGDASTLPKVTSPKLSMDSIFMNQGNHENHPVNDGQVYNVQSGSTSSSHSQSPPLPVSVPPAYSRVGGLAQTTSYSPSQSGVGTSNRSDGYVSDAEKERKLSQSRQAKDEGGGGQSLASEVMHGPNDFEEFEVILERVCITPAPDLTARVIDGNGRAADLVALNAADVLKLLFERLGSFGRRHSEVSMKAGGGLRCSQEIGPGGLGFSISGGIDQPRSEHDPSIYISKIVEGSIAQVDGRIEVGDTLTQINDDAVVEVEHQAAADALKKAGNIVQLRLQRLRTNPLRLEIDKGKRGLGISIAGGIANQHVADDNGIFVTKIVEGGAAWIDGRLQAEDKILAVGNIPLESCEHDFAVNTLKNSGQKIVLTVERPGLKRRGSSVSSQPPLAPSNDVRDEVESGSLKRKELPRQGTSSSTMPRSSVFESPHKERTERIRSRTPSRSERTDSIDYSGPGYGYGFKAPIAAVEEEPFDHRDVRSVVLTKGPNGLGFNIVGGEEGQGIFISYIVPGGACDLSGQLRKGDRILSVNGINLRNASHEDAADALKGAGQIVTIVAQYSPEEYRHFEEKIEELKAGMMTTSTNSLRPALKRSLYVRSLIDYDPSRDSGLPSRGLPFCQGDILHVTNASDNEWWQAKRVNEMGQEEGLGIIPSKQRVERKERARIKQVKFESNEGNKSASTSTLDRITGRKKEKDKDKDKDKNSKKFAFFRGGKEQSGDETSESEKTEEWIPSYEPVVYERLKYVRPVIVMGPFKDRINDDLIAEYPDRFSSCVPHTTRPKRDHEVTGRDYHFVDSREQMERDIQNHLFIEAGQYSDNLYGTSLAAVQQVAERGLHCILDVSGAAVKRLQSNNMYPIVVYVKPRSVDALLELNRRISEETGQKTMDRCAKLEKEFGHLFTAVVTGDSFEDQYNRVKEVIYRESAEKAWIPSKERV